MTWWHFVIVLIGLKLVLLAVLAAFWLGMAKAGDAPELRKKPLPKPTYSNPAQDNRIIAERKREQDEQSANFRGR
jgi:hypothetical protein